MRSIPITLRFLLLGFIAQAQLILPIDKANEYIEELGILPKDNYFKDVNTILNNYLGRLDGSLRNKKNPQI